MKLWHGSSRVIREPRFGAGNPRNDYGLGFYCTEELELAQEWACPRRDIDGFANGYHLDEDGLAILDFADYTVLHWLTALIEHRTFRITSPVAFDGAAFLRESYHIDLSPYDIVRGYRADDSYFSYAQAFLNNTLSLGQVSHALKLGNLGKQIVIRSELAFSRLEFIEAVPSSAYDHYPVRLDREIRAKEKYRATARGVDRGGVYLSDLLAGKGAPNA